MSKQKFWKSYVFWIALITSAAGVVVVALPETKPIVDAFVAGIILIINALANANNPTNPEGFGANEVKE